MSKKTQIISAFENLDADMLDVLLNDGQSYMDVPKEIFVKELRRYFKAQLDDWDYKIDYKAYPGECSKCNKGKTGYSFINSDNECYMSMVFEENDDDFTDIYKCACFNTYDKEIEEEWLGISFYEEDKITYLPTEKNIRDEKESQRAVKTFKDEITTEGILSADFCINWLESFEHLADISEVFDGKFYRYKKRVKSYINKISSVVDMMRKENIAKEFYFEFCRIPVMSEYHIKDWLIRCDYELNNYKYGFYQECNYLYAFFEVDDFKIDLKSVFYSQSVATILEKYVDWIPYPNPVWEQEMDVSNLNDDGDFPF